MKMLILLAVLCTSCSYDTVTETTTINNYYSGQPISVSFPLIVNDSVIIKP